MKHISILGSTGSIGCNTLKVVEHLGDIRVAAMAAGRNITLFTEQVAAFQPELAACADDSGAEQLERGLHSLGSFKPRILVGEEGLNAVATHERAETVVSATVGAVGFVPTLRAIEAGKRVALANKETLVMAGELMTAAAAASGAEILPVDSEHNAIHQCLRGERPNEVRRVILTASGGPFRTWTRERIAAATRTEALNHPNWSMGDKITIDSATLMNKGLEVIEAKWLFGLDADRISVIVHPQSVVHSMVEMVDGSLIAQMGVTDMKHAIQYALTYPDRMPNCLPPLDLAAIGKLDFEDPDTEKFPCLALAFEAMRVGGTMPTALNAANEVSVDAFLGGKISIDRIAEINRKVMDLHSVSQANGLDVVLGVDKWARETARLSLSATTSTASN
ncbi:MAG TPA: 1-deoxy-D-xylulose-5-phosphate reductoisomerase [Pyrinomonadaceae bacterium]|mgnify:CR=1 FL=1|nr:1-deoxy-D-xylulose-5-phosphate reductoisomerase [Chloracidobacterium sp.]MBP9936061.1 1-deoxy-D-xylulose-5-phosphate reductoisomerase [Pyrinomonadaceae bacterium]HQX55294.1 1-deoxy-D-xylulose-5-phosphate reductoisomerase [Pyrinomonadaceae bacterium]HQY67191.1 1-deoxy-D-xylulose-5-phosphate reductoisomerase [Pyrinomonadaceae bacterium]HRA39756.1 1-deoxy-D-xylulose-5-phosphate reductoisomerase [Pyrinomonadaceae bacterium]